MTSPATNAPAKRMQVVRFRPLCSHCIRLVKWSMMTGYGITGACDLCGNYSDVAICKMPLEGACNVRC